MIPEIEKYLTDSIISPEFPRKHLRTSGQRVFLLKTKVKNTFQPEIKVIDPDSFEIIMIDNPNFITGSNWLEHNPNIVEEVRSELKQLKFKTIYAIESSSTNSDGFLLLYIIVEQ